MIITKIDLENILAGACFLASGGGGPISLGQSCIDANFDDNDSVDVTDFDDIKDTDWIIPCSGMGQPSATFNPEELNRSLLNVIEIMQHWCKDNKKDFTEFKYILPMEVGTVNSVLPIIACKLAKDKGKTLSVVNADPSGRATPTLPLTLFAGYDCDFYPNFIASGNIEPLFSSYKLESLDHVQECFSQMFTSDAFKNSGGFSLYPMSKQELKPQYIVKSTMLDALNIGKIINETDLATLRVEKVINYMNNDSNEKRITKKIFYGTLRSINGKIVNGTDVDTLIIDGIDDYKGNILKVATKNENIFANIMSENGEESPYIMGPDSICYLLELLDAKNKEVEDMKILDVTGLADLYDCPMKKTIKLHVIGIDAPKHVKECTNLISNWCKINSMLGGADNYTQPWLSV